MKYATCGLAVAAFVACAVPAFAEPFAVYPAAISLEDQTDTPRLIAVESREDGVTLDRTPDIAVTFDKDGIAKFENGHFVAAGNGDAVATVTYGDKSAAVPVKVANAGVNPAESFHNDVEPVLMKAGCNAGSCHGSASGKNGFRVSLFGFDPGMDYINLTRDNRARRMNAGSPEDSLLLLKATGDVAHDG
ncbi:MAG: cell surface protein, partial [Candidatus Hydrogenedentes bacterium]|nr:cell surface protein [Candidatus Hydrogenedentota bacterium]